MVLGVFWLTQSSIGNTGHHYAINSNRKNDLLVSIGGQKSRNITLPLSGLGEFCYPVKWRHPLFKLTRKLTFLEPAQENL